MKFLETLVQTFANKPIDWDELEESLIRADLGVAMTTRIIKTLQEREAWSLMGISDVVKVVREEIARILPADSPPIIPAPGKPKVILLVGVNGTGKTTSTAKLARYLQQGPVLSVSRMDRHTVLLAAADTFRAAAIEQLGIWAERLGVEMIRGQYNADPAALCYEAYQAALKRQIDFLLCNTQKQISWPSFKR
jgi:fused signal recognition particle receptor